MLLKNLRNRKSKNKRKKKVLTLKSAIILLHERQKILNAFEGGIFSRGRRK